MNTFPRAEVYRRAAQYAFERLGDIRNATNRWNWAYTFAKYVLATIDIDEASIAEFPQMAPKLWRDWLRGFGRRKPWRPDKNAAV